MSVSVSVLVLVLVLRYFIVLAVRIGVRCRHIRLLRIVQHFACRRRRPCPPSQLNVWAFTHLEVMLLIFNHVVYRA